MLSAPIVITPPEGELLALEEVKTFLRVDGDALDTEIAGYIAAAIAEVQLLTGTYLALQRVEIRAEQFDELASLETGPVTAVVSVKFTDIDGTEQTLDPERYELLAAGLEAGIVRAFGAAWPKLPAKGARIRVQLDVGYAELPADLRLALLLSIRAKFDGTSVDLFALTVNHRIWL